MADELQALLERISEEELKKADSEKEKIISQAKEEADEIIRQAKAVAQKTLDKATHDAEMQRQKGEESLRQASRDVLINLEKQLKSRVQQAAEELVKSTMNPALVADAIQKLITEFASRNGDTDDIKVLLNPEDLSAVEDALKATLAENLKANCTLSPSNTISGGFRLKFEESGIIYDFTDKSLADTLAEGLGPKLASIITA